MLLIILIRELMNFGLRVSIRMKNLLDISLNSDLLYTQWYLMRNMIPALQVFLNKFSITPDAFSTPLPF